MSTLMEELPQEIKRLQSQYGSDNPFVTMLKEQLRALEETQGKSAQEIYQVSMKPKATES